jgi:hypothetical protein
MGLIKMVWSQGYGTITSTGQMCLESGYFEGLYLHISLIKIKILNLVKLPDSGHLAGSRGPSQFRVDDLNSGARQEGAVRHS